MSEVTLKDQIVNRAMAAACSATFIPCPYAEHTEHAIIWERAYRDKLEYMIRSRNERFIQNLKAVS